MKLHAARLASLVTLLAVAFFSAGCLVKENSTTICLEPDGSARWTVLERNIHATGETPADRQREEDEFMAAVAADRHPNAVAFRGLGGSDVRTEVVSARWPFAVVTEARFPDIARVFQQIADTIGEVHGHSRLERNGNRTTWTITLDYDPASERSDSDDASDADLSLFGDDGPVFFMRHGQFVDAVGFDITDDGRVAKLVNLDDHDWNKDPHLVLSVTWVATEAVSASRK